MANPSKRLIYLILAGSLLVSAMPALPQDTGDEPREIDLIEQTGRRLAQLDVSVSGPDEAIGNLTVEDFELVVGGRFIESFIVDRLCKLEERVLRTTTVDATDFTETQAPVAATPRGPKPTYLFYFDQHHLTAAGRQNSLDIARTIVDQLVKDGGFWPYGPAEHVVRPAPASSMPHIFASFKLMAWQEGLTFTTVF